jgi:hypothetical protein
MSEAALSIIDPTEPLVEMCKTTRRAYYDVARTRSRMTAAIVRAQAMQQALAAGANEQVSACLLAMANPKLKMVERIGDPTDPDVVNVMLMAIWNGFTPGDGEFSIFGGRGGATMYIKGPGYKTLMADLGASDIRVQPGFPKQQNFKEGGAVWLVDGYAECTFDGKKIKLLFAGDGAVKVPCNLYRGQSVSSDGIDLVLGKAERRMAKALYAVVQTAAKVAAAEDAEDDATADAQVTITQLIPARLESPAVSPLETYLRELSPELAQHVRDHLHCLLTSETMERLEEAAADFKAAADTHKLSERIRKEMRLAYITRKGEIASE